jgi:mono/diheme cytochrome c family protein
LEAIDVHTGLIKRRTAGMALSIASVIVFALAACATQPVKVEKKTGAQLFYSLCASCHGEQGRGDGPVADLLVTPPPDLTLIAQRNNGFFPALDVFRTIDGREGRAVHGTRSMPVWGRQLYFSDKPNDDAARAHADEEIALVAEYIRSLQQ